VPFWMFGGRGFPERADLAEQDLIPDSREAELSERARTPHAHVS